MKQGFSLSKEESVVFLLSGKGKIYKCIYQITDRSEAIFQKLKGIMRDDGGTISAMICFLPPSELDIPSFYFCKALLQLDRRNSETLICMQGESGIIYKKLSETMPHVMNAV